MRLLFAIMPITAEWDNEDKTIVHYRYEGRWTWDDFYRSLREGDQMMDSVDHTVHVIVNMTNSSLLPSGAVTHIAGLRKKTHRRVGITVLVGASSLVQAIHAVMVKIYPGIDKNFRMISTLEEARASLGTGDLNREPEPKRREQPKSQLTDNGKR